MKLLDEDLVTIREAAKWFARKTRTQADELISIAAVEILTEKEPVIDKGRGQRRDLIRTIAINAMKDYLKEGRPMIKIPTRSSSRHELDDVHRVPIDPQTFVISESMGPADTVMIEDSLMYAAESPMEKAYMKLRLAGLTNKEAIVELDLTDWKASTMLEAIESRFREEWDE